MWPDQPCIAFVACAQTLSGAVVVSGELDAQVMATGINSFFGKTMALLSAPEERGHLQMVGGGAIKPCAHCLKNVYTLPWDIPIRGDNACYLLLLV